MGGSNASDRGATFTLSIVSHGQAALVGKLISDLAAVDLTGVDFVITHNLPEPDARFDRCGLPVRTVTNTVRKGFGANHNAAFALTESDYFVVVNPDIRLPSWHLGLLAAPFSDPAVGACAPAVVDSGGDVQDNARRFPTVRSLARRLVRGAHAPDYNVEHRALEVDWLAGMFVVYRRTAFASVGGFDERRFFMYYEDVDICRRLHAAGWKSVLQPAWQVVHDAQRASHRNLKHLRWHATSALRYLTGL